MERQLAAAVAAALATIPCLDRAAAQTPDTGKVCLVSAAPARPGESLAAAVARSVQGMRCQPGDVLEVGYSGADPMPVVAQLCDFGRQIHVYDPPPSFAQVGIKSELVCSLASGRRTDR